MNLKLSLFLYYALFLIQMGFAGWMFIDVIRNTALKLFSKIMWAIGLLIFGPLVAMVYAFLGSRKRIHQMWAVVTFVCLAIMLGFPQLFMSGSF